MKEIKNIVIVNDFNYINGGAAKVAIDTAKAFSKNKNINVYFFSAVNNIKKEEIENVKYICTNQKEALKDRNIIRGIFNGIWNIKAKRKFQKLLNCLDKDNTIIHIHGWMKALSSSIFYVAEKNKFKTVVTFHDYFSACPNGGFYNYKKEEICNIEPMKLKCIKCNCDSRNYFFKIYRIIRQIVQNNIIKINQKIKYIVSISDYSINILKGSINKNAKIKRIYNPIQANMENRIENINENKYYLFVGRLSKEKGADLFCKAITKLGYKGIVVGEGDQKRVLQKEYKNIEFVGWKNNKEIIEYMKKARALIFPSLWYEGAPLTPLEALSIGLPCIVSDKCAAIEFIQEKITGLIFKRNSIDDLIEKIKICENDEFLKEISNNAYEIYWKDPLNENRYKTELEKFYLEILND